MVLSFCMIIIMRVRFSFVGSALLSVVVVRSMCNWTLPCASSLYPPFYTSPMASSAHQHWTASPTKEGCHDKLVEKIIKHDSWPIQPDILSPPLLRLTSRKPLWLDLQPVDIKSRWRHNWKLAQVVNSHLVCDPTIWQPGFDLPRQQWSLLNRFCT